MGIATPDLTQFKKLALNANLIPVWKEIAVDFDTPVSLFAKLGNGDYAFLLESLEGGEKWGRYSFIGLRPFLIFKSKGHNVTIWKKGKEKTFAVENPIDYLRELMAGFRPAELEDLPRFYGGAVGYFGYDMVRFMERLPDALPDTQGFHDSVFMFPGLLLVFDSLKQSLKIIANIELCDSAAPEEAYNEGLRTIDNVITHIKKGIDYPGQSIHNTDHTELRPEIPQDKFEDMVRKAKEYIRAGDIIQVVLSQRFSGKLHSDPFNIYRALRTINPSPYMFFLRFVTRLLLALLLRFWCAKRAVRLMFDRLPEPCHVARPLQRILLWSSNCSLIQKSVPNILCWLISGATMSGGLLLVERSKSVS